MGIKDLAIAENLPEQDSILEYEKEILPDGTTQIIPHFRNLFACDLEDDDIFVFLDRDGKKKQVCYGEIVPGILGYYKAPI